jgi:hypothetical protein
MRLWEEWRDVWGGGGLREAGLEERGGEVIGVDT